MRRRFRERVSYTSFWVACFQRLSQSSLFKEINMQAIQVGYCCWCLLSKPNSYFVSVARKKIVNLRCSREKKLAIKRPVIGKVLVVEECETREESAVLKHFGVHLSSPKVWMLKVLYEGCSWNQIIPWTRRPNRERLHRMWVTRPWIRVIHGFVRIADHYRR